MRGAVVQAESPAKRGRSESGTPRRRRAHAEAVGRTMPRPPQHLGVGAGLESIAFTRSATSARPGPAAIQGTAVLRPSSREPVAADPAAIDRRCIPPDRVAPRDRLLLHQSLTCPDRLPPDALSGRGPPPSAQTRGHHGSSVPGDGDEPGLPALAVTQEDDGGRLVSLEQIPAPPCSRRCCPPRPPPSRR